MIELKLPYENWQEKLSCDNLTSYGKRIEEKWRGIFSDKNFRTIVRNNALELNNHPSLTKEAKIKIIDGSFENYYYLREHFKNKTKKSFGSLEEINEVMQKTQNENYEKKIDGINELLTMIHIRRELFGKKYVNEIFENYYKKNLK